MGGYRLRLGRLVNVEPSDERRAAECPINNSQQRTQNATLHRDIHTTMQRAGEEDILQNVSAS